MCKPNSPTVWLSAEMACALAAACPPLKEENIVEAAQELAAGTSPARVALHLLRDGTDLLTVQQVVEALGALRDLGDLAARRSNLRDLSGD